MYPYLLYSDVHLHNWDAFSSIDERGLNTRLAIQLACLDSAYSRCKALGGKQAFCAGDLFHQRGKISPSVLIPTQDFYMRWAKRVATVIMPGNHDLETNEVSRFGDMTRALPAISHCPGMAATDIGAGEVVITIPWLSRVSDLLERLQAIGSSSEVDLSKTDIIIHAPLDGVLRGVPEHGLTPERLLAACPARRIFCGHYHHHIAFDDRVYSIGALTHQTWGDVGTKAGYLLVYPDHVEHWETQAPKFVDITDADVDDIPALAKGNYVRTALTDPTNDDVAIIRNTLTEMGAMGVLIKAVQTKSMTHERATVGASIERLDESVIKFAEAKGGKELAARCAAIMRKTEEGAWSS